MSDIEVVSNPKDYLERKADSVLFPEDDNEVMDVPQVDDVGLASELAVWTLLQKKSFSDPMCLYEEARDSAKVHTLVGRRDEAGMSSVCKRLADAEAEVEKVTDMFCDSDLDAMQQRSSMVNTLNQDSNAWVYGQFHIPHVQISPHSRTESDINFQKWTKPLCLIHQLVVQGHITASRNKHRRRRKSKR